MTDINYPASGHRRWKAPVASASALPTENNVEGDARYAKLEKKIYTWDGSAWGTSTVAALSDLTDVVITSPAVKDILIHDGATFANKQVSGDIVIDAGGVTSISSGVIVNGDVKSDAAIAWSKLDKTGSSVNDLADVTIATGADKDIMILDGSDSQWKNRAMSGDVVISRTGVTSISSGVIVNDDVKSDAAIAWTKLNKTGAVLTDVGASASTDNKVARYDTTNLLQGSLVEIDDNGGIQVPSAQGLDTVAGTTPTLNIGAVNASVINIGAAGKTVNIIGDLCHEHVTDLTVTDKLITLNKEGGATSGNGCGIEVEEGGSISGYAKVSADRNSWILKAPGSAGDVTLTPGAAGIAIDQSLTTTSSPAFAAITLDGVPIGNIQSAGVYSGCEVTNRSSGTVDVAAGVVVFKTTDSDVGATKQLATPAATGVSLTDNSVNWIYANYNAGSPTIAVATDWTTINKHTQVILGCAHRIGTEVYLLNTSQVLPDFDRKEMQRLWEMRGVQRTSGAAIGQTGTRNITVSAGVLHSAVTRFTNTAIDTSGAGTFTAVYRDGGTGWTEQASQTQLNNTEYDDGSGTLATLGANKYGVHWVYGAKLTGTTMALYIQFGQGSYSLAEANAAMAPTAYPPLSSVGVLLAKLIIQKNASSILTVENIGDPTLIYAQSNDHEELAGLLGGAAGDHYHLTAAQHTIATQAASASVSGYVNTSAQTFAGAKTFNAGVIISGGTTDNFLQLETGGTAASTKLTLSGTTWQFGLDTTVKSSITEAGAFSGVTGVFATSVTSPIIYGGSGNGDDLTLESTSGTKSGSLINFGASGAAGQIDRNLNTWTIGDGAATKPTTTLPEAAGRHWIVGAAPQLTLYNTAAQGAGNAAYLKIGCNTAATAAGTMSFVQMKAVLDSASAYGAKLVLSTTDASNNFVDGIEISSAGAVMLGPTGFTGQHVANGTFKVEQGDADSNAIELRGSSATALCRIIGGGAAGDSNYVELAFCGSSTDGNRELQIRDSGTAIVSFFGDGKTTFNSAGTYGRDVASLSPRAAYLGNGGEFGYSSSSRRFKINEEAAPEYDLLSIQPTLYNRKDRPDGEKELGLIAEDVEKVCPYLVFRDMDGAVTGIHYEKVAVALLSTIRSLKARIEALESK
jgi:hypothetical protein